MPRPPPATRLSQHESTPRKDDEAEGAWANRGIVIREWSARLGSKAATPWIAERGVTSSGGDSSTTDIVAPPGVTRLKPGDFVEAVVEYLVVPQHAEDYRGPNAELRVALGSDGDTWKMIHREATGNRRDVKMERGELVHLYPDVRVAAVDGAASFALTGGLGFVPFTITGLKEPGGGKLKVEGSVGVTSALPSRFPERVTVRAWM